MDLCYCDSMKQLLVILISVAILGAGCNLERNSTTAISGQPVQTAENKSISAHEIDLSGQGLAVIPMDTFLRTDLLKLNLSNNRLSGAPQSQIGHLKNLVSLDLSDNLLTGLPAELGQLSKLETLDVSNNRLTGLPMELGNLNQLRILDISGNPYSVKDLEAIASKLPNTEIRR